MNPEPKTFEEIAKYIPTGYGEDDDFTTYYRNTAATRLADSIYRREMYRKTKDKEYLERSNPERYVRD